MPIKFRYLPEANCLYVVGNGKVSLQDFLDYHEAIHIPDPPTDLRILSDYRDIDPSDLTTADIEFIRANALERTEGKYRSVKEAIVVSDSLAFGLSRMYDGVVYSENYEVNVFTNVDAAQDWLGVRIGTCRLTCDGQPAVRE